MIKLGVCTGLENAPLLAKAGFDYIETALNALAALSEADFDQRKRSLAQSGLSCEAVNCMLPGTLAVVGPQVDREPLTNYLKLAFARAQALGVEQVVFGSGGSRGVPAGASHWQAWKQLADFLSLASPLAAERGLKIAIEPLSRQECNIINHVSEALALAALLDLPQVGVLGDTYHMAQNDEPLGALAQPGSRLWHLHIACPQGRAFPKVGDPAHQRGEYQKLFAILKESGYTGRVSVEGNSQDFNSDIQASFALLDPLRR
ncbi:sugar phosphate isomerase/epimerase family protein [Acutalibacter intestini]|uniref:sugar phosphate isomerase/epimerase family protein n=1 Tax=Acutalibacter intestini TaxID=3093659 RepID=UPI002AC966FD|nr:sugar phosphate isomerase/epimerase family protein [Acutalibacter sp. M00204]